MLDEELESIMKAAPFLTLYFASDFVVNKVRIMTPWTPKLATALQWRWRARALLKSGCKCVEEQAFKDDMASSCTGAHSGTYITSAEGEKLEACKITKRMASQLVKLRTDIDTGSSEPASSVPPPLASCSGITQRTVATRVYGVAGCVLA